MQQILYGMTIDHGYGTTIDHDLSSTTNRLSWAFLRTLMHLQVSCMPLNGRCNSITSPTLKPKDGVLIGTQITGWCS
jgi:hypothetical protein